MRKLSWGIASLTAATRAALMAGVKCNAGLSLFPRAHSTYCFPSTIENTVTLKSLFFIFFNYYYFYCEFLFILYRFVPTLSSFEGYCATTPVIEGRPLSPFSQSITNALSKRRLFRCTVRRDSNPGPVDLQYRV